MANENLEQQTAADPKAERKRLSEEKKKLKQEQKAQKKEAKKRAKDLALEEANIVDEDEGSTISVVIVTIIIIIVWLGILALLIKLDVGGFGSNVLAPVLGDVPVLNKILPETAEETEVGTGESYGGYNSLRDAVDQIEKLELQLNQAQSNLDADAEEISKLKAEVERLSTFERNQIEFQRIKNEFYEEVVYAENGPGAEAYARYYESMDPETAQNLYKEVVKEERESEEVENYAQAYSEMKPKEAAAIFEKMTNNLDLAARILGVMEPDDRGKILGAMDPEIAARITKIMDPES